MDLHPELRTHLRKLKGGAWCIYHPLVLSLYCGSDPENAYFNELFERRRSRIHDLCRVGRWRGAVFNHEKPFRLQAFLLIRHHLVRRPEIYWSFLRALWQESESVQDEFDVWERLLLGRYPRRGREHLMYESEREALAAMPERFTVYHGLEQPPSLELGWSWTLSQKVAGRFARRFVANRCPASPVRVATGVVRKRDVLAYFTPLGEEEILVPPRRVKLLGIEDLRQQAWVDYDARGDSKVYSKPLDGVSPATSSPWGP